MTTPSPPERPRLLSDAAMVVLGAVALMWAIELVDSIVLSDRLQGGGIHPRRADGIDGILWAPLLHGGIGHLIGNTVPFLVLGGLVSLHGSAMFARVTATIVVLGGALTWVLARGGNHIGASGVVFGFLGFLVAAAIVRRNLRSIALGVVAVALYGGLVFGLLPSPGVSWEGHLFGGLAGVVAAAVFAQKPIPSNEVLT